MAFLYDQISALNTGVDPGALGRLFDAEARLDPARLANATNTPRTRTPQPTSSPPFDSV